MNSYQTNTTAKTTELPVSLQEAKTHLRIYSEGLDEDVRLKLAAAVEYCEDVTGRVLRVSHTVAQKYPSWPCNPVRLDRQAAYSVSSVAYYDADGNSQTVDSANYRLHQSSNAASYLEIDSDFSRPSLEARDDAVTVTYLAGYSSLDYVPNSAKMAILLQLSLLWGDLMPAELGATERARDALLASISPGQYR